MCYIMTMNKNPRLSIELKDAQEIQLKNQVRSIALANGTNLHDIIIKALSEFCAKNK